MLYNMAMSSNGYKSNKGGQKYQGVGDLFRIRQDLSKLHKAFYIGAVFLGLVLVWYGVWTAIGNIWPLSNPAVAIVLGVLILLATGKIKDLI